MKTDISSTLTSALSGLQVGVNRARTSANEISRLSTNSDTVRDAIGPLVNLQKAETEVAVNSKVVKAEGETLGRFVDETV